MNRLIINNYIDLIEFLLYISKKDNVVVNVNENDIVDITESSRVMDGDSSGKLQ